MAAIAYGAADHDHGSMSLPKYFLSDVHETFYCRRILFLAICGSSVFWLITARMVGAAYCKTYYEALSLK